MPTTYRLKDSITQTQLRSICISYDADHDELRKGGFTIGGEHIGFVSTLGGVPTIRTIGKPAREPNGTSTNWCIPLSWIEPMPETQLQARVAKLAEILRCPPEALPKFASLEEVDVFIEAVKKRLRSRTRAKK